MRLSIFGIIILLGAYIVGARYPMLAQKIGVA